MICVCFISRETAQKRESYSSIYKGNLFCSLNFIVQVEKYSWKNNCWYTPSIHVFLQLHCTVKQLWYKFELSFFIEEVFIPSGIKMIQIDQNFKLSFIKLFKLAFFWTVCYLNSLFRHLFLRRFCNGNIFQFFHMCSGKNPNNPRILTLNMY